MRMLRPLGVLILLAGCLGNPPAADPLLIVPVVSVQRADLSNSLRLTGEFHSFQEIDVMAKVSGYVKDIAVDIGDRVQQGQLLATLEVPEMVDDLTKAQASAEAAKSDIEAAQDDLQRSQASHEMAHLSFSRTRDVAKREPELISQNDLDLVRSHDLEAEAQISSGQARLRVAEDRDRMAHAELKRLETLYRYTRITAPFAGIITHRYADVGSMIQAGTASQSQAMPLVRLAQDEVLRLIVPVPESNVAQLQVGSAVQIDVRACDRSFPGQVTRFTDEISMATRTMNAEIDVPNPDFKLVPGMTADILLRTERRDHALSLPLEAIAHSGDLTHVYQVDAKGVVHDTPVTLGLQSAELVEVLTGVSEGDQVTSGHLSALHDGERVTPKLEPRPEADLAPKPTPKLLAPSLATGEAVAP